MDLYKPDPPQSLAHPDAGFVPYILVDRVKYSDAAPWPGVADGGGLALQRRKPEGFGNDVANWTANLPTPGWHPIKIDSWARQGGSSFVLTFGGVAGSSYTVQYSTSLSPGAWSTLTNMQSQGITGPRLATDSNIFSSSRRYYRVVTPALP